jgi:hypothetical protein
MLERLAWSHGTFEGGDLLALHPPQTLAKAELGRRQAGHADLDSGEPLWDEPAELDTTWPAIGLTAGSRRTCAGRLRRRHPSIRHRLTVEVWSSGRAWKRAA